MDTTQPPIPSPKPQSTPIKKILALFIYTLVIAALSSSLTYWYITGKTSQDQSQTTKRQIDQNKITQSKTEKSTYNFTLLGIIMDILPGWEVKSKTTQEEGATFYEWTVVKEGSDGKIKLSSSGFRGGFHGCEGENTPAVITDIAPTKNSSLLFISYSYTDENETKYRTGIIRSDDSSFFRTATSENAMKNSDLRTGNYFICLSYPSPFMFLKLNKKGISGFATSDAIDAVTINSSNFGYESLSPSASSYSEIKTMLTSIK